VNDDGTLRLSGWSASEWLHNREKALEEKKWQTYMTVGVIVEAAAIITLATITALPIEN